MATSTNYGWSEPDNTSLVKDGAQAIRTLGDAIDTSLWNSGYGQAGKNKIINGNFGVWQRGTSFALSGGIALYCSDRWQGYSPNLGRTITRQGALTTGYYSRVQRDSGNALTGLIYYGSTLESQSTIGFIGQPVTMSFSARSGANFSSASGVLSAFIVYGTGTNQNLFSGLTGQTTVVTKNVTLTSSFQTFDLTGTVNAAATQMAVYFVYTPVGTAGANDYFDVQNVQLEYGSKATPFQTASGGSIQGELAMCQRYFERMVNGADNSSETIGVFQCFSTTQGYGTLRFVVPKRATPSLTFSGNADFIVKDATGTNRATTLMASGTYSPRTANVTFTIGTTNLVAGNAAWMLANSATATMDVSAEL
jgi:hypothetical protein